MGQYFRLEVKAAVGKICPCGLTDGQWLAWSTKGSEQIWYHVTVSQPKQTMAEGCVVGLGPDCTMVGVSGCDIVRPA